jgi:PilZ domain-containing protein
MERLGRVVCSQQEEIWVSLLEVQGRPHLEFRIYGASGPSNASPVPRGEAIVLPIDQIPGLLRVLTSAQEVCMNRGLLYDPRPASVVTMEQGDAVSMPLAQRASAARRDPRLPLQLRIECRLVDPEKFWPSSPVVGEIRDISLGGAQVWLLQRLPRYKQVDVAVVIDGKGFQARAKIVSVDLESQKDPKTGLHRHGLRWAGMEPKAREILTEAIANRSKGGG